MTDELKAPERIWATEDAKNFGEDRFHTTRPMKGLTEYVRADRIATLEAALADMTQQRDEAREHWAANEDQAYRNLKLAIKAERERDAAMAGEVKVRELVWEDVDAICTRQKAPALGGHYSVVEFDANTEEAHFSTNIDLGGLAFVFILEPDPLGGRRPKRYSTIEAAKAAAQADYSARIMSALTPDPDRLPALTAAAEPVCYLPTKTVEWLDTYDGPACATRTAVHNRPIKTDGGVPVYRIPANALAALSRIEAQAEARGWNKAMLTAITHVAEIRNSHTPGPIFKALNEAMGKIDDARFAGLLRYQTDATEAAAKGGM